MNQITGIVIIKLIWVEDNFHLEYTLICDTKEMCRHLKLARVSQVLIKLGNRDPAATANEPFPPWYECVSLPNCYCWQSAVLLPVDMGARVHTDTLALRRAWLCMYVPVSRKRLSMPRAASEVLVTEAWHCRYVDDAESIWQPSCVFVAAARFCLHTCVTTHFVIKAGPFCNNEPFCNNFIQVVDIYFIQVVQMVIITGCRNGYNNYYFSNFKKLLTIVLYML